jgi:hypothetical protein
MALGGAAADRGSVFPSAFASAAGAVAGGFAAGREAGGSGVPFCCVMARSTSPGREMCERSILVLISSSPWAAREEDFAPLGAASERPRRCLRTKSASWSSRELECVFFSVTPTEVRASRISLLLTSNSRARSLILTSRNPFAKLLRFKLSFDEVRSFGPEATPNSPRSWPDLLVFRGFFSRGLFRRSFGVFACQRRVGGSRYHVQACRC